MPHRRVGERGPAIAGKPGAIFIAVPDDVRRRAGNGEVAHVAEHEFGAEGLIARSRQCGAVPDQEIGVVRGVTGRTGRCRPSQANLPGRFRRQLIEGDGADRRRHAGKGRAPHVRIIPGVGKLRQGRAAADAGNRHGDQGRARHASQPRARCSARV